MLSMTEIFFVTTDSLQDGVEHSNEIAVREFLFSVYSLYGTSESTEIDINFVFLQN